MATRYLTALDYSDWHTNVVLKKHAKKRPLGDLESRYQYTPAQPVLSCRTVDIDVSGTRTYRPRSTTDIIAEQHKLIHSLYKKSRAANSAPPRRSPRKGLGLAADGNATSQPGAAKIRIQGRPYTSQSQTSAAEGTKTKPTSRRPKTTGRLQNVKSATDSFMVLKVDEDLLETRRSQNELTNQIHAHWRPENANLNQGHFMRGQKRPDDVPPTLDAWLTFGGTAGETGGVVDAFANFQSAHDYYNIEGSVGSRVAQQLQKGDRIRIGINGEVLSHDLKVKKWVKCEAGDANVSDETKESEEEEARKESTAKGDKQSGSAVASPDSTKAKKSSAEEEEDMFGEMIFESLDDIVKLEEPSLGLVSKDKKKEKVPEFPLNWDDQLTRPEVKVISARTTPRDNTKENLCETHPVLFKNPLKTDAPRPKLATTAPSNGYRVKQRPIGNSRSDHRLDAGGAKVKAITFDHNSPEDEQRLSNITVDDVIQMRLEKSASSMGLGIAPQKSKPQSKRSADNGTSTSEAVTATSATSEFQSGADKPRSQSSLSGKGSFPYPMHSQRPREASSAKSSSTTRLLGRPGSSVPSVSREMDLSIMTPSHRNRRSATQSGGFRGGQGKGLSVGKAMAVHRGLGGGVSSINAGPIPGDTEFIQISQSIRNPNSSIASASSGVRSLYSPYTPTPVNGNSPPRSNTPLNGLHNSPETSRAGTPDNQPSVRSEQDATSLRQSSEVTQEQNPPPSEATQFVEEPEVLMRSDAHSDVNPGPGSEVSALSGGSKAINIPTGSRLEEEEEEELSHAQRRERSLRDQQIDQITSLLGEAILGGGQK